MEKQLFAKSSDMHCSLTKDFKLVMHIRLAGCFVTHSVLGGVFSSVCPITHATFGKNTSLLKNVFIIVF